MGRIEQAITSVVAREQLTPLKISGRLATSAILVTELWGEPHC